MNHTLFGRRFLRLGAALCLGSALFAACQGKGAGTGKGVTEALQGAGQEIGKKISTLGREENPFTGQKTLALVSNERIFKESFATYENFLAKARLLDDTREGRVVREVGEDLRRAAEAWAEALGAGDFLRSYRWEFHLVDSDEANAWCMPGGKIVVYSGLLPAAENRAGLATVMSHELSHALLNHGRQRQSAEILKTAGEAAAAIAALVAGADRQERRLIMDGYDLASTYLGTLPFSRRHETEADRTGLMLMYIAGYDPREAAAFWRRMSALSGGGGLPELLSTHPSDERRIEDIERVIAEDFSHFSQW